MSGQTIGTQTLKTLQLLAGLDIPEDDLKPLATAMQRHLASIAALQELDLTDIEPPLTFKAAWDE
jgi:Asp-tRNA(Asn)/Glu-tRNA(Gln) amidotransferase C subunit